MKKLLLLIGTLGVLLPFSLRAEQRIGVVDMDRLFREFYKSRIAEEAIKQQGEAIRAYLTNMKQEALRLESEARRCGTNALNPALSASERSIAQTEAKKALAAARGKQAEIELYTAERSEEMRKMQLRKREEILKEIRNHVQRRAAAEGYQFVLDNSLSASGQSLVLVHPAGVDLTDSVLRDLNRSATKAASRPNFKEK